jgi:hypothetical protein
VLANKPFESLVLLKCLPACSPASKKKFKRENPVPEGFGSSQADIKVVDGGKTGVVGGQVNPRTRLRGVLALHEDGYVGSTGNETRKRSTKVSDNTFNRHHR